MGEDTAQEHEANLNLNQVRGDLVQTVITTIGTGRPSSQNDGQQCRPVGLSV